MPVDGVAGTGGRGLVLFETPRLVVRRATADDADALLAIFGDPENVRLYGTGQPLSRADVERLIASYPLADDRIGISITSHLPGSAGRATLAGVGGGRGRGCGLFGPRLGAAGSSSGPRDL
jgi:hypothetical protein